MISKIPKLQINESNFEEEALALTEDFKLLKYQYNMLQLQTKNKMQIYRVRFSILRHRNISRNNLLQTPHCGSGRVGNFEISSFNFCHKRKKFASIKLTYFSMEYPNLQ